MLAGAGEGDSPPPYALASSLGPLIVVGIMVLIFGFLLGGGGD